jgi:multiple sugar transport system permease protein
VVIPIDDYAAQTGVNWNDFAPLYSGRDHLQSFIGNWNSCLWPLLSAMSERMFPLPVGLPTFEGTYATGRVITITGNIAASLPAIIVFLIFEQQITRGVALTGIKE